MNQVIIRHMSREPSGERPGNGIEADLAPEEPIRHRIFDHRAPKGDCQPARGIVVCGDNIHKNALVRQSARDRPDGSARATSKGSDRRDYMQYFHAAMLSREADVRDVREIELPAQRLGLRSAVSIL